MDPSKPILCVLDASSYVGFWVTKGLLSKGYPVHAAVQNTGKSFLLSSVLFHFLLQTCGLHLFQESLRLKRLLERCVKWRTG
ncbi:hypothetical protein IC575_004063 [Cucumis melo]